MPTHQPSELPLRSLHYGLQELFIAGHNASQSQLDTLSNFRPYVLNTAVTLCPDASGMLIDVFSLLDI